MLFFFLSEENINILKENNICVLHQINATLLSNYENILNSNFNPFDIIIFQNPEIHKIEKKDLKWKNVTDNNNFIYIFQHRDLIFKFMKESILLLNSEIGAIHITKKAYWYHMNFKFHSLADPPLYLKGK